MTKAQKKRIEELTQKDIDLFEAIQKQETAVQDAKDLLYALRRQHEDAMGDLQEAKAKAKKNSNVIKVDFINRRRIRAA